MLDIDTIDTAAKAITSLNSLKILDKHRRFADIYINEGVSAHEAYRRSKGELGQKLSIWTVKQQGYKWLNIPTVQAYIKLTRLRSELEVDSVSGDVEPTRVIQEEAALAFLDPKDLVDEKGNFIHNLKKIPERTRRALASIKAKQVFNKSAVNAGGELGAYGWEVEYKFWDKGAALGRLEKILGMVKDGPNIKVKLSLIEILQMIDGGSRGILPAEAGE